MNNSWNNQKSNQLEKLKLIRSMLTIIAVVLAIAIAAVFFFGIKSSERKSERQASGETILEEFVSETLSEEMKETEEATPSGAAEPTEETEPTEEAKQTEEVNPTEELDLEKDSEGEGTDSLEDIFKEGWHFGENQEQSESIVATIKPNGNSSKEDQSTENQSTEDQSTEEQPSKESVLDEFADEKEHTEEPKTTDDSFVKGVFWVLCLLLAGDIAAIVVLSGMIGKMEKELASAQRSTQYNVVPSVIPPCPKTESGSSANNESNANNVVTPVRPGEQRSHANIASSLVQIGVVHNIGARPYQEDSYGTTMLNDGVLAVVADGMGGLSAGDRVSQKIVKTMHEYASSLHNDQFDGLLELLVKGVNQEVNQMLGPEGIYKSGSTLLAVLVRNQRFHWITVGDSRIYYYHNGKLTQLNQEHNLGQELLIKVANGEMTEEEAKNTPKKNRVTSFIGMGKIKYIDQSKQSIPFEQGDRIVLMSDGVFNTLSNQGIAHVLQQNPNVEQAAAEMERLVVQRNHPRQDNFTAVIIGR